MKTSEILRIFKSLVYSGDITINEDALKDYPEFKKWLDVKPEINKKYRIYIEFLDKWGREIRNPKSSVCDDVETLTKLVRVNIPNGASSIFVFDNETNNIITEVKTKDFNNDSRIINKYIKKLISIHVICSKCPKKSKCQSKSNCQTLKQNEQ